jgi:hypothetical protein
MRAVVHVCLVWNLAKQRQVDPDWLFDRVNGFAFGYKTSGRGAIHAHGTMTLADALPPRLRRLQVDGGEDYVRYLEALQGQSLPGGLALLLGTAVSQETAGGSHWAKRTEQSSKPGQTWLGPLAATRGW